MQRVTASLCRLPLVVSAYCATFDTGHTIDSPVDRHRIYELRPTTHDLGGLFQAQLGSMSPDSKDTLGFALISLESSQNIMMPLLVCGCLLLLLPLLRLLLLLLFLFVWES